MSWPYGEIDILKAALAEAKSERDEMARDLNAERLKDGSLYKAVIERAEKAERDLAVLRGAIQGERQHTDEAEDRARVLEGALVRIEEWIGPRGALPVTDHAMAHDVQVFREMVCAALSATPAALRAVERARKTELGGTTP